MPQSAPSGLRRLPSSRLSCAAAKAPHLSSAARPRPRRWPRQTWPPPARLRGCGLSRVGGFTARAHYHASQAGAGRHRLTHARAGPEGAYQAGLVPSDAQVDDACSGGQGGCRQHGSVCVAYLAGRQLLCARLNQLVACGQDAHAWLPAHLQQRPQARSCAHVHTLSTHGSTGTVCRAWHPQHQGTHVAIQGHRQRAKSRHQPGLGARQLAADLQLRGTHARKQPDLGRTQPVAAPQHGLPRLDVRANRPHVVAGPLRCL
jgi:hypothetical protein